VIPSAVFASIVDLLQEDRFAFDGELLAALLEGGHPVEEVPIDWIDIPGSKVSLVRDSFRMVKSLFLIGSRKKAGAYRRVEPR
jgi:dolichyl-phosphate beta-glucosyltransferase